MKPSLPIVITMLIVLAATGGAYFYFTGALSPTVQEQRQQEENEGEAHSIAGQVTSVNAADNSFVLLQPKEARRFTVRLGESTEFVRLSFPFDIDNPSAEAVLVPEQETVTIGDLKVGDWVFVRSADAIVTGQDIVSPAEVQILP